ncbi:hypothetical protein PTTG_06549 [Puccinia triticina 1-1 BBBD Race 1]|uniref:Uncharacterized protein n=1 Tax=Puccinia triticina (isolate 1-1 / race 1 (BBBD)) TaxID=630390 RepID=A0A180GE11_PUCT1|nr:hypothetical protein PTTG_06549 [Puccinia triticina 1-1 BBBD Race 1]WAR54891.1 hypothetical protein PtB15_4B509 [Puccinia triticina]
MADMTIDIPQGRFRSLPRSQSRRSSRNLPANSQDMDQESGKDRNYTAHPEYEKHHHNNAGQETYNKSTPPPNGELLTAPKNDSRAPPNKESHPSPNNGSQPAPNDNDECDKDEWSPRPSGYERNATLTSTQCCSADCFPGSCQASTQRCSRRRFQHKTCLQPSG